MAEQKTVFFTGATGYIGSVVLSGLVSHPAFPSLQITALIRDPTKAASLNSLGIQTVVGSYSDYDLLTREAEKANIVFTCVDSNNPPAAKAILAGLKKRYERTGVAPILIHTSGTGIVLETVNGLRSSSEVHSDMDSDFLATLPPTQFHRAVDLLNIAADTEGYVRTHIVCPGCPIGLASGIIPDLGVSNRLNIALSFLISPAIKRGQGAMVGPGLNTWPIVDIDDVGDLYMFVFSAIWNNPSEVAHGRDGHYFCISQDALLSDFARGISKAMVKLGVGKTEDIRPFDEEELKAMEGLWPIFGGTVHARADRSLSLGWRPRIIDNLSDRFIEEVRARLEATRT